MHRLGHFAIVIFPPKATANINALITGIGFKSGRNAALFHDGIGGVAGFDLGIDSDISLGERAEPDIVIALSASLERAPVLFQYLSHLFLVLGHYRQTCS